MPRPAVAKQVADAANMALARRRLRIHGSEVRAIPAKPSWTLAAPSRRSTLGMAVRRGKPHRTLEARRLRMELGQGRGTGWGVGRGVGGSRRGSGGVGRGLGSGGWGWFCGVGWVGGGLGGCVRARVGGGVIEFVHGLQTIMRRT